MTLLGFAVVTRDGRNRDDEKTMVSLLDEEATQRSKWRRNAPGGVAVSREPSTTDDDGEDDDENDDSEEFATAAVEKGKALMRAAPKKGAVPGDLPLLEVKMTTETVGAAQGKLAQDHTEVKVRVRRMRVIARATALGHLTGWDDALTSGWRNVKDDMAVTEMQASADAGAEGVSQSAQAASRPMRAAPQVALDLRVRGPLLVLPSPSLPSAGVLVRVGDLKVLGGLTMVEGGAPPIVHKVVARLNTTQVLVAPPQIHSKYGAWHLSRLLTEDWRLVDGANPHLLIPHLGVQVNAETVAIREATPRDDGGASSSRASRRSEPPMPTIQSSYEGETSGREPSDSTRDRASSQAGVSRPAKKLCITVALSSATVSLAVSEAVFLQSLLPEVGQLIANHGRSHATKAVPKSPRTAARRQGAAAEPSFAMLTETSENDSSGRFEEDTLQGTARLTASSLAPAPPVSMSSR